MYEQEIQKKIDEVIEMVVASIGKPPYESSKLLEAADRIQALAYHFERPAVAVEAPVAEAPVVEARERQPVCHPSWP